MNDATAQHDPPSALPVPARRTASVRYPLTAPFGMLFAGVVALFYRLTLLGQALYWGDLFLYFFPLQQVVSERLRHGRIPLWNPYIFCGQPLVGNPQSWVFYPSTLLAVLTPVWLYYSLNMVLHVTLAAWFCFLYLKRRFGDMQGAILGAFAYAGSGCIVARVQFPPMVQSVVYLPVLLLLTDRLIEKPTMRDTAWFGVAVALLILAAHTQMAYMTLLGVTCYALASLYVIRRDERRNGRIRRIVGAMTAGMLLGLVLAAVHLVPAVQLFVLSNRKHLTFSQANRFVFLPQHLLNFLFPAFYGTPNNGDYWGQGNMWEPYVYVGVAPLVLALYAVVRCVRLRLVRFFTLFGLVALMMAMGRWGGLYWVAYYVLPGLASFHDPARFVFLTTFALAALSAIGVRELKRRGWSVRAIWILTFFAVGNIVVGNARFNPTVPPDALRTEPVEIASTRPAEDAGRIYTMRPEVVWRRYISYGDYGQTNAKYVRQFAQSLIPNIGMTHGIEEASGYEPVNIKEMVELDNVLQNAFERQSPQVGSLLPLMDVQVVQFPLGTPYQQANLAPLHSKGATRYRFRDPLGRAWLVRNTRRVDGSQRVLATLGDPTFDPRTTALVSGSDGLGERLLPNNQTTETVVSRSPRSGLFVAEVDSGEEAAFLVWSSARFPGWVARLDQRQVRIERANHAFCGVVVPPGKHTVQFTFEPFAFRFGLYLSLVAVAWTLFCLRARH